MKDKEFLFEDIDDLGMESIRMLQERLFGLPDKKKTENAPKSTAPAQPKEQAQEVDQEVTPTYINNLLSMVRDNTQKTVERFIESEYNKTVEKIKQQNPKAFWQYLIDHQGNDDEDMFKTQFLGNLWKDIAKAHGAMVQEPRRPSDAEPEGEVSKSPFLGVFERSLFNKDNYPNVSDILNFKFGADKKELDRYFHVYDNITTDKEKIARIGFSDESALLKIMTLKLAMIRLGYMFLRDDPRLEEIYGKDPDNPKGKSGREVVEQEMKKMASQYSIFNADANKIATDWYNALKKNPPQNMSAYEKAVISLHNEIEKTIREARKKEEEKEDELGSGFVRATRANVEQDQEEPEPQAQEPEPQAPKPEPQAPKPESDEKQKEVYFANDRYQRRQMLSPYSGQNAILAVENPEKVLNLSENDFRDMKTIFAYNNPFTNQAKEKFQQSILSSTREEFVKFLKNLRQDTDMFAKFFTLWNSDNMVDGKLFTNLLKGEEYREKEAPTKASAKTKTKKVSPEKPKEAQAQKPVASTKAQPKTQPKKKTKKPEIGLSDDDFKDAALQSSKGIKDYLKGGGTLNP
jgi:hypothetical protein